MSPQNKSVQTAAIDTDIAIVFIDKKQWYFKKKWQSVYQKVYRPIPFTKIPQNGSELNQCEMV